MEGKIREEKVKQGRRGTHLLVVLVVGVILAVVALWAAARYNNATTPRQPDKTLQQGQ